MTNPIVPWAWKVYRNPGVGVLIQHRAWWWPARTLDVRFRPQDSTTDHQVPAAAIDDLLAATTVEQAMAAIRRNRPE